MNLEIFPWQTQLWNDLLRCKHDNHLSHAMLFIGEEGIGKKHFALLFSSAMLCKNNTMCGLCHSCLLFKGNSHPDLMLIEPEKKGQLIKVDQIREAINFIYETALLSKIRIIIINLASSMNTNAANALLKTLEEPPVNTLLILISETQHNLPATIVSRCHRINFKKPKTTLATNWLKSQNITENIELLLSIADGAPLKARDFLENEIMILREELYSGLYLLISKQKDPLDIAAELHTKDIFLILNLLLFWAQDLLRYNLTNGKTKLINFDYLTKFAEISTKFSKEKILNFIDLINKNFIVNRINLNKQLLLEELFINWALYASS